MPWILEFMVAWVTAAFFLFCPSKVQMSARFYQTLFPNRGRVFPFWCAWRQYHHFSRVFVDRLWLLNKKEISFTSEGWEALEKAREARTGGVILMSHMGSWEVAAHLLKKRGPHMKLMLYMGVKQKKQIEGLQKQGLAQGGVTVVGVGREEESPLALIEGLKTLQAGGFVSMTGDVLWSEAQRAVTASFLNHSARLPAAPHMLAMISGAPVFTLFAFRTGRNRYHFKIMGPRFVRASTRKKRAQAMGRSIQSYAEQLEAAVREHPLQWYHFDPFLEGISEYRTNASPE